MGHALGLPRALLVLQGVKALRQPPEQKPCLLSSFLFLNTGAEVLKKCELMALVISSIRGPSVDNHIIGTQAL